MKVAIGQDSHRFTISGGGRPGLSDGVCSAGAGESNASPGNNVGLSDGVRSAGAGEGNASPGNKAGLSGGVCSAGTGEGNASPGKLPVSGCIAASPGKALILGGVAIEEDCPPLEGNSDADVVLHALCNAISGITTVNILGGISDDMCFTGGITDSSRYVAEALRYLENQKIIHISFSIECKRPKISPVIPAMRTRISEITGVPPSAIGITATSGEELTDFGRGLGIQVFCVVTAGCP